MPKFLLVILALFTAIAVAMTIPSVGAGYHLKVIIRNSANDPISGATVTVVGPNDDPSPLHFSLKTAPDGSTEFTFPKPGSYHVQVDSTGLGSSSSDVSLNSEVGAMTLVLKLKSGKSRILAHVSEQGGGPISGAEVTLKRSDEEDSTTSQTNSEGTATFVVGSPQPGGGGSTIFEVKVHHPDYEDWSSSVQLERGQNKDYDVNFSLKKRSEGAYRLDAHIYDAKSRVGIDGATVSVTGGSKTMSPAKTDGEGKASIALFDKGQYQVTVTHPGHKPYEGAFQVGGDSPQFALELGLESTDGPAAAGRRMLCVRAFRQGSDSLEILPNAEVFLSTGQTGHTDDQGEMWMLHNMPVGTKIDVTVDQGPHLKNGSAGVSVHADANDYNADKLGAAWSADWFKGKYTFIDTLVGRLYPSAFGASAVDDVVVRCDPEDPGIHVDGSVSADKGVYRVKEEISVSLGFIIKGLDVGAVGAKQVVELMLGSSRLVASDDKQVELINDEYQRRTIKITCDEPGEYTVKVTTTAEGQAPVSRESSFTVNGAPPKPISGDAKGHYQFVTATLSPSPPPGKFYGGDLSGVVTPNSFVYKCVPNGTSMAFTTTETWDTPPESLPADIPIDLLCSVKTVVEKGNPPPDAWGLHWTANQGNYIDPVEGGHNAVAGWIINQLRLSGDGDSKLLIHAGCPDDIVFSVVTDSCSLFPPVGQGTLATYTYRWQAGPATDVKKPKIESAPTPEVAGTYSGDGPITLGSTSGRCDITITISPTSVPNQMLVAGELTTTAGTYKIRGTYWVKRAQFGAACESESGDEQYYIVVDGGPGAANELNLTVSTRAANSKVENHATFQIKRKKSS